MSDRRQDFELPLPPAQARESVRLAVSDLGWKLTEEEGEILVRERPAVLVGHWPLSMRITIVGREPDRSTLSLWGRMAGFGPFVAERLKETMDDFVARVERAGDDDGVEPAPRG